jgi:riboflavin transporter FmnP
MASGTDSGRAASASSEAATVGPFATTCNWRGGAVAGLVATVTMGAFIAGVDMPTLRSAVAGLYGQAGNLFVGWAAHLVHGTLFGVVFAVVMSDPGLHRVEESVVATVLAGVFYGMVLAVAGAGIVMPIWLSLAGFASPPTAPFVTAPMLAWHVVYGVVLGATFSYTWRLGPV